MGLWDMVKETASGVADTAGDLYSGAKETAGNLYQGAKQTTGELYQGAKETAGELYSGAADTAGEIYSGVKDAAGNAMDHVTEFVSEHRDAIGGPLIGAPIVQDIMGSVGKTLGKAADWVYEKVDEMTSDSGLGSEVDELMKKSPTLTKNIEEAKKAGFTIRYGEKGKGTFMDPDSKEIVVDPDSKGDTSGIVQSLAHETGHALYTQDPEVGMEGLTKEEYVKRNTMRHLKDEGEATITNMKVREEILKATGKDPTGADGADIGVAGAQSKKYLELYKKYPDPKDRDKLREEIGKVFAKGETPSTDLSSNYEDYYGKAYKDAWDEAHK